MLRRIGKDTHFEIIGVWWAEGKKNERLPKSTILENDGNLKYLHNRWRKYLSHLLQGKETEEFTVVIKSVQLAESASMCPQRVRGTVSIKNDLSIQGMLR